MVFSGPKSFRDFRETVPRAGKSRTALLGTRTARCDEILGDFVAFKHPSNLQSEKQMPNIFPSGPPTQSIRVYYDSDYNTDSVASERDDQPEHVKTTLYFIKKSNYL